MGKKSTPSAPAAPDPAATAAAQTATNKETAIAQAQLNRINQITPQGTLTYSKTASDPYNMDAYNKAMEAYTAALNNWSNTSQARSDTGHGVYNGPYNRGSLNTNSSVMPTAPKLADFKNPIDVPEYTQTTTYSPEQQKLYELQTQAQTKLGETANDQLTRLSSALSQPISYDGAPALQSASDPATQAKAEEAIMARLNPQLDKDRASLENRLATQGITLNSEAYKNAADESNRSATDARMQAILQSIGLGQSTATHNNQARQQYIQEAASVRNQPLNEISALLSGSQVSAPQFSNYAQTSVAPTDYTSAANLQYQSQLANWNAQNESNNSTMGGLFGLGSSALMAGAMFL